MRGASRSVSSLAMLVAWAGCVAPTLDPAEDAADSGTDTVRAIDVLEWQGHLLVGAWREAPAHFTPSDQVVAPLWRSGFVLDVVEPPEAFEVQLDWTSATPTLMNFMIHAPHGSERPDENGWSEYTTASPGVATGPLCIRIPAADVVPGYWYPMAHSAFGADIELLFTVRTIGGAVSVTDEHPHGHETNPEEIANLAETQVEEHREWEECELDAPV